MVSLPKLTKKQKKSIAFRERRRPPSTIREHNEEDNAIPIVEFQDVDDVSTPEVVRLFGEGVQMKGLAKEIKGVRVEGLSDPGKAKEKVMVAEGKTVKRKREAKDNDDEEAWNVCDGTSAGARGRQTGLVKGPDERGEGEKPKRKRPRGTKDDAKDGEIGSQESGKQRLILFVGNLKYSTSADSVRAHFSICDPPPTIRLLTPKSITKFNTRPAKSKGCAFLEFSKHAALQQALRLHQSILEGRKINVELTAGGGGKSEKRLSKVKERNKELHGQRTKKSEKQTNVFSEPPQRYSATSGVEQTHATRRTWTVGNTDDDKTHRGGQKHTKDDKKRRRPNSKTMGTGVNAIPID